MAGDSGIQAKIAGNRMPIIFGIAAIIFFILFSESVDYNGLIARLAEWQFNVLGRYFPALTLMIPVVLIGIIVALILWVLTRRREQDSPVADALSRVRRGTQLASWCLLSVAAVAAIVGIGSLVKSMNIDDGPAARQQIQVGQLPLAVPHAGPARLNGALMWRRLTRFDQFLLVDNRSLFVVPVVGDDPLLVNQAEGRSAAVRYFVQVYPDEFVLPTKWEHRDIPEDRYVIERGRAQPVRALVPAEGRLVRHGLPAELTALYRKVGLRVHPDHYVLFRDRDAPRWSYYAVAGKLFLLSALALIAGLYQRRQYKRLVKASTPAV